MIAAACVVRYTEDSAELKLGESVWKTVTGKGSFRHDYLDTTKQIAAAHVVLLEDSSQILYSTAGSPRAKAAAARAPRRETV